MFPRSSVWADDPTFEVPETAQPIRIVDHPVTSPPRLTRRYPVPTPPDTVPTRAHSQRHAAVWPGRLSTQ